MSNKQVIAIFIIGIALLLGAFWAGLYVVKQDTLPSANQGAAANQNAQAGAVGRQNSNAQAQAQPAGENARYVVHVGTYGTLAEAKQLETMLRQKNYVSTYVQMPSGQESLYRVNIGPYDKRVADQVAAQLSNERKGIMIIPWAQN